VHETGHLSASRQFNCKSLLEFCIMRCNAQAYFLYLYIYLQFYGKLYMYSVYNQRSSLCLFRFRRCFCGMISLFLGWTPTKCSSSILFKWSGAGWTRAKMAAKSTNSWWIDSPPCSPKKPRGKCYFWMKLTTWSSSMCSFGGMVAWGNCSLK